MEAGEAEAAVPRRRLVNFNEYDGPIGTIRVGFGLLTDYATYSPDANSEDNSRTSHPNGKWGLTIPVSRIVFKSKRPISWSAGVMYDWSAEKWVFRQHT